ncbi:MAG: OmpA family protein [Hydrogenophaga sp.]|uniref:outer membrane beta-barrel protein n=1 Tax=Hydrogenophaga sp. TaxID=1904254 RepID=UPI002722DF8A|nr:outer membrane beta-barrel protein [Hydrogenophaga sp.]MDO9148375.1 OmpA family protein [Hydrogenophaga sp.]MDP2165260.1 OmpA family protein [Hydrogenophaga sp.]MDP3477226.1 OmpA family protein [Hydrogenophaga sp.]
MTPTTHKSAGALSLLTLALFASPMALAQQSGWYGGASAGRTGAEIDDARITSGLLGQGFNTTSIEDRDRSTGFKLFGGYQLSPHFALEGGYFDLGKFGYTAHTDPAGTLNGEMRVKGLNLDLVGTLPLTGKLSAIGRVGVNYSRVNARFSSTGAVNVSNPTASKNGANAKYGVGLNYAFSDAVAMRLEVERYRVNDAIGNKGDIDMVSVGLVYRFGGPAPQPVARAVVPEPVLVVVPSPATVQAPPPPVPAAPAVIAPKRVSLSAESLFGFDANTVKPEGRMALDQFARDLSGTTYESISVEGHTDRLGSEAYNQRLSEQRAAAVKSHLVTTGKIDAGKISAVGRGETQPVTKPGDCQGNQRTTALVACLQPDRRVDVEVTGTR